MILNGKVSLERADNGFILSWYEGTASHREVFEDGGDLINRLSELLTFSIEVERTYHNPAVDPDIAAMMPDGAPESAYQGD
jgi:hypothetical protein